MNRAIWKFPIHGPHMLLSMPVGARILAGQMQHGTPTLWAIVDPTAFTELRGVRVVATGDTLDPDTLHWQTFTTQDGALVWHIFVEPTPSEASHA